MCTVTLDRQGFKLPLSAEDGLLWTLIKSRVIDVAVNYDKAFAKEILRRWYKISQADRIAANRERRGHLDPDDPSSFALYDCLNYQRGHADVFREVYKKTSQSPPRKGERLLVVDIGSGAATVGVALAEALKRKQCQRLDYLAFDPHPMMRKLGKRILKRCGTRFHAAKYVTSLESIDFAGTDRLLFTFSYVVHQRAVTDDDTEQWATLIRRSVSEVDQDVELIFTTANRSGGAFGGFKQKLEATKTLREWKRVDVRVKKTRFLESSDGDGQIHWYETGGFWKVMAEHWILSV